VAHKVGFAGAGLVVTDRHARGLVRKFLQEEGQRSAEVRRRMMRIQLRAAPSLRASHRVLEQVDKAWAPQSIASCVDTSPDGAARLGVAYLDTVPAHLEGSSGLVARSRMQRYLIRPDDGAYRSEVPGFAAFTQHSLERVMQRGLHWNKVTRDLAVAAIVANARLHEFASSNGFKRIMVPGHCGVFVGDLTPDQPFLRFDTFLPIGAAGRRHCDLLVELAGLLWTGDRYRELMPALFYPGEPSPLMDAVLRAYEKHRWLMRREHEPGADWFGQAVAHKGKDVHSQAEARVNLPAPAEAPMQ